MNNSPLLWALKVLSMIFALVAVIWTMNLVRSPNFQVQASGFFRMLDSRPLGR